MPTRATKRGAERTPLSGDYDVIICGASFAGLSVARQLTGSGARVLIARPLRDRRAPDLGLRRPHRVAAARWASRAPPGRSSASSSSTRPHGTSRYELPWTFSTFDYRELCELLDDAERRRVRDRQGQRAHRRDRPHRPRRRLGAADRRRARLAPDPRLRRRLPAARRAALARARGPPRRRRRRPRDLDRPPLRARRATAGASRPATSSGSASARSTPASTSRTRPCCSPRTSSARRSATRATGSRTSCARRPRATIFFVGDSAGPLPAADRRGHPHRVLLRDQAAATSCAPWSRAARTATRRSRSYASSPTRTSGSSAGCCAPRSWSRGCPPGSSALVIWAAGRKRFVDWSFGHYLRIAPPEFAGPAPAAALATPSASPPPPSARSVPAAELSDRELRLLRLRSQGLLPGTERELGRRRRPRRRSRSRPRTSPPAALGAPGADDRAHRRGAAGRRRGGRSVCRAWLMRNTIFLFAEPGPRLDAAAARRAPAACRRCGGWGSSASTGPAARAGCSARCADRLAEGPLPRARGDAR